MHEARPASGRWRCPRSPEPGGRGQEGGAIVGGQGRHTGCAWRPGTHREGQSQQSVPRHCVFEPLSLCGSGGWRPGPHGALMGKRVGGRGGLTPELGSQGWAAAGDDTEPRGPGARGSHSAVLEPGKTCLSFKLQTWKSVWLQEWRRCPGEGEGRVVEESGNDPL